MEDDMMSENKPEVRLSVHNHVHDAGTDDGSILQSISPDQHFKEQMRSSKFEESPIKSVENIENNNSLLPIEGELINERSASSPTQKVTWLEESGRPGDDSKVQPTRSITAKETSKQKDCEHTHFGVSETTTAHLDHVPFMVGSEEVDDPKEADDPKEGGKRVVDSLLTDVLDSRGQSTSAVASFLTSDIDNSNSFLRPVETHFVVVAIDFGTAMSGYAFSFVRDPSSIHMMRKWEGGDPGVINQKTPTTLLLSPEGDFHSFGFTARDFYHDLDNKEAKRWLYFEKFKMALHYNAKLNKETTITASNGKCYPAIKVFSQALRYFRDHALQELSDQSSTEILNEDIRWVITVPAIWKAPAKQFMRQAAYEAGIASPNHPDQLLIALEPEAASIYVRRLKVYQLLSSDSSSPVGGGGDGGSVHLSPSKFGDTSPFSLSPNPSSLATDSPRFDDLQISPESRTEVLQMNLRLFDSLPRQRTVGLEINDEGTRYMVVDCGGGTVDITVHEMEGKHGYLHELYKATGGPFGSVGVDLAFESLLSEIFGSEFIESFKTKRPAGWVDLMIAFESRKRAANPYKDNPLNISLPFSFIDYYKKTKGNQIEGAISKYNDQGIRWSSQGMLRLAPQAMKRLFHSTIERIKQAIGNVLNTVKDIKYLFLVGGFAESAILQHEIRHEFSHILKILIPQDVALTILKGAVCFGLDPTIITVRRSRLTYGVEVLNRFNAEQHPKSKMVRKDGIEWCTEVFDVFVTVDQPMALGDTVVRKYAPAKVGQKTCIINIFSSEKSEVKFVTDVGVIKCGTLTLCLTDITSADGHAPKLREIQAVMTFGDTEIKVDAVDVTTGTSVGASIDFLNK